MRHRTIVACSFVWLLACRPSAESSPRAPIRAATTNADHEGAVMVILADQVFVPGETDIDSTPDYITLIWHTESPLPERGKAATAIVEEHAGLVISDGTSLWDLEVVPENVDYPECDCDAIIRGKDDHLAETTITKTFATLIAKRRDDGEQLPLIAAKGFHVESGDECLAETEELERSWQLVAVAGPHVAYIERVDDGGTCDLVNSWTIFESKFGSLTTATNLAALEAELPGLAIARARKQVATKLELEVDEEKEELDLRPGKLELSAIYPSYAVGEMQLLFQYGVRSCYACARGDWTNGHRVERAATELAPASSLAPPAAAQHLLEYAWREYGDMTPIGWSIQQ